MMRRTIIVPLIALGCLIVIWVGTVAAVNMPSPGELSSTLTPQAAIAAQAEKQPASPADDPCLISQRYPAEIHQWCALIENAAQENNLPPNLIAAVMLQESGGAPLSYSSSGAVGLMQVMPRDGIAAEFMCINGPCFASRPTMEELQDPAFNISYGTHMLSDLYARYGSYREALYHYGPIGMDYRYADLVLKIWENYQ